MLLSTGAKWCATLLNLLLMFRRDQLRQNVLVKRYFCDVDIAHLIAYNEELAHRLTTDPLDTIPLVSCSSLIISYHCIVADACFLQPSSKQP